ncbi:MAG TPA: T9SS type A sorting domain-containing protein [Puia sp.]|nr:T9SS type A sorting domain-containing protein [Puia sp.]
MKIFLTLILLALTGVLHAQRINTIEYFFDTDPGIGSGTKMTLNSGDLDSTVNFALSGLTSGVHILNVRLKNSNNTWGTTYQSPVLIATGTDGSPTITSAEYFFDTDPGFGNGQSMAVNQAALDSVLNLPIAGLSSGVHLLNIRLRDANNTWSTTYQSGVLIVNGVAGAATIVNAEYYFDKDPGFGNGQSLPINKAALDSVVNFSVTGLTPGAHTIFVRLKNSNDSWSFAGQGNFILSGGTPGVPQIKSLEFFVDSDSGVNRNAILPLVPGASIDTTLSIPIPDNGGDSRTLGLRMANITGQVGNVALANVSLCDIYRPKAAFRTARYGSTFSLISNDQYNPTKHVKWLVNDTLIDSSYTTNYIVPNGYIGTKRVTEIAGSGCRLDTITQTISVQGVESYEPVYGSYGGDYVLNIYGGGLDTSMSVYLQNGSTIIYPYAKYSSDGNSMSAVFDFHSFHKTITGSIYMFDSYDVHIVFPDGYDYHQGRTISFERSEPNNGCNLGIAQLISCHNLPTEEDGTLTPYVTSSISGSNAIRAGVWSNQVLNITNTSATVVKGVPFYLLIPSYYDVDTSYWNIVVNNPALKDSLFVMTPVDTIANGIHLSYKLYALICPIIQGHETVSYPFRIRSTVSSESSSIYHWVDKNMFGSPFKAFWPPCVEEVFNLIIGFVPVAGCLNAAFDMSQASVAKLSGSSRAPDAVSMGLSVLGTAISCIPGGTAAVGLSKAVAQEATKEIAGMGLKNGPLIASLADKGLGGLQFGKNALADGACSVKALNDWEKQDYITRAGFDPNHLSGSFSFDTARHFVNNYSTQKYEASFENKPTATASAQHVMIVDTLNPDRFVFSSFQLRGFSIGDSMYSLPPFRRSLTRDVVIKSRQDMKVRFTADFDTLTGILHVDYFSISNTGVVIPPDSLDGFLPADVDGVTGTGSVRYEISARVAATMDTFSNIAHIYFDANVPIATNLWLNTVDTTAPKSTILRAVPVNDSTVKLMLQRSDEGSGINYNEIFIKASGDSLFRSAGFTSRDSVLVTADPTRTYQFFTKAVDNVNNKEIKDSAAEVTYSFSPLPVHLLSFSGVREGTRSKLLWTSTDEVNFSRYDVERSADGITFEKIGIETAKGGALNNNYIFYDELPFQKSNYYRLKQVDKDGAFVYSRVIRIDFDKAFTVAVTPVPAHDYIIIDGAENFRQVQLVDMSGRIVKQFSTTTGNNFDVHDLSAGMYLVRLVSDNGITTLKMVKE